MARIDYILALRSAGVACMMATVCSRCYKDGHRVAFFGVPITGTTMGDKPKDRVFQKAVWCAAKKHIKEVHGLAIIRNGAGGWKTTKLRMEEPS